jgi:DMSO reductase anchor subunit
VVLVGAELIGRLLFYNLHMTVGSLLLVLSQLAMEDR